MRGFAYYGCFILLGIGLLSGCDTKKKLDRALDNANEAVSEARTLLKKLNDATDKVGGATKMALSGFRPAQAGQLSVPPAASGGTDVSAERDGEQGMFQEDVDDDGTEETVEFFAGKDGTTFYWFESEGICFLAWEAEGAVQVAFNQCGATDGAYLCEYAEATDTLSCNACNPEGSCAACTEDSCEIPASDDTPDNGGGTEGCDQESAETLAAWYFECTGSEISVEELCEVDNQSLAACAEVLDAYGCDGLSDPACE